MSKQRVIEVVADWVDLGGPSLMGAPDCYSGSWQRGLCLRVRQGVVIPPLLGNNSIRRWLSGGQGHPPRMQRTRIPQIWPRKESATSRIESIW